MDLAAKDSYIQKLASKVIHRQENEPKKRPYAPFKGQKDSGPPQKKKKCKKKSFKDGKKPTVTPVKNSNPVSAHKEHLKVRTKQTSEEGDVKARFSTVDVLRRRLHEKIEETRAQQGVPKEALMEEVQAKRAKRKLERERKKRKKKEFQLKRLAEAQAQSQQVEVKREEADAQHVPTGVAKRQENAVIFNAVETVEDKYADKVTKRKAKKQRVKGQITPLTGRNYKQLLSRLEARKDKLDKLREKDEAKAQEVEDRMKWTNALYKAEGVRIKDDEAMLRSALASKEKKRSQRKKQWDERSQVVVEKMQKRQDKRRRNIQNRKNAKMEKKKKKARKKGRVLLEDLEKVNK
ncbi:surfeit locus protein 6 isoform X1 [Corythoichthys intestinalis]|uniref:surfeit locus protein 6 isoform X1 n=1 Tax=Corythoichthys intestinalis TaxID=161448 RepID=UPI0025A67E34|nr:surfeit locus protein 6 isoform X1 [Corythoichthys intestinalis]